MNRWRTLALSVLAVTLMSGCVYVPYYHGEFDPVSPEPWYYPADPYVLRDRHYHRRHDAYRYDRRRMYEEQYSYEGPRRYRPDPSYRDQRRDETEVTPPARADIPESGKGSTIPRNSEEILTATKGSKPGRVKIPFPPYTELDVSGLASGSLAKDPSTGRVFRLP